MTRLRGRWLARLGANLRLLGIAHRISMVCLRVPLPCLVGLMRFQPACGLAGRGIDRVQANSAFVEVPSPNRLNLKDRIYALVGVS